MKGRNGRDNLLTIRQCAEELHTSCSTIYRAVRAGAPCRHFGSTGRQLRVDPDQILDWMDGVRQIEQTVIDVQRLADQRRAMVR